MVNNTAVVIPTYNESKNIEKLIRKIFALYKNLVVFIVDDNSPDKTAKIVMECRKKYQDLYLISRKSKGGRGSAVIEGFKEVFKNKDINYFIEMDADFSHRPEEIKKLLGQANKYDVVIGSRYLKDSKIYGWSIGRKVFSKLANFYCRLVLGVPISDYTNGFRVYRRKAANDLLNFKIRSKGYIVLSETVYLLYRNGHNFSEISTIFKNRTRGKSNFNISEVKESLLAIPKLKAVYRT